MQHHYDSAHLSRLYDSAHLSRLSFVFYTGHDFFNATKKWYNESLANIICTPCTPESPDTWCNYTNNVHRERPHQTFVLYVGQVWDNWCQSRWLPAPDDWGSSAPQQFTSLAPPASTMALLSNVSRACSGHQFVKEYIFPSQWDSSSHFELLHCWFHWR